MNRIVLNMSVIAPRIIRLELDVLGEVSQLFLGTSNEEPVSLARNTDVVTGGFNPQNGCGIRLRRELFQGRLAEENLTDIAHFSNRLSQRLQ
jgi:hypothetical protein